MKWLLCVVCTFVLFGCAQTRVITVSAKPADASIRIDDLDRGRGPVQHEFVFNSPTESHKVSASRFGYKDAQITITPDYPNREVLLELKPQTKLIQITVQPGAAIVSIDGKRVSDEPVTSITRELPFAVDDRNNWLPHTITADRDHLVSASAVVKYTDRESNYVLTMPWMKKSISVASNPPGAEIMVDFQSLGVAPVKDAAIEFPVDLDTNEYLPRKLRAEKKGYDPVEVSINWDNGKTDYQIDLAAKTKTVRFLTDPPGSRITIDGQEIPADSSGVVTTTLQFPPVNDAGDLKTYTVGVSKKTADAEWEPATMNLAWDNGRKEYSVVLKEILTRPVSLLEASLRRDDEGWQIEPNWTETLGMKDTAEGGGTAKPQQVTRLAKGTQLGSTSLSPDGSRLLFTVLTVGNGRNEFRSQMVVVRTDGSGGEDIVSDGKSLEIMPSFTPGGDQIVFASNRASRRLKIWGMSASGAPGITQLTHGETSDLWPCVDADPKPRLFYQAMVDSRPDSRLYVTQLGTIFMTDLTAVSGQQPRVSPRNDAILFSAVNEKTGKRDVYRMSDRGGAPENLTNTPDVDEFDASWNKDGSRIVYASDAAADETGRHNYDIWMLDLSRPQAPVPLTTNASRDDSPMFDTTGNSVYFRSNRGGQWQIWRLTVK